jgi:transposase
MAIWQDPVDTHGFDARYSSVRRFVQTLRQTAPEPHAVIITAPGEESQVDYGDGPMVRHPVSGKYRRTRLFVLTLGYSRKSIRLLVWHSSAQIWAELHERAFRRLGGSTRVVVLDNLKEGVLTPDIYDPALNPLYRHVLAHYGVVALPCRVGDPDRKGKSSRASATHRRRRSRGCASRRSRKHKPISNREYRCRVMLATLTHAMSSSTPTAAGTVPIEVPGSRRRGPKGCVVGDWAAPSEKSVRSAGPA